MLDDLGALTTKIPFFEAVLTSILSTPIPARPITFNIEAFSITSRLIFVALLTIIASYFPISFNNSAGD